MYHNAGNGNHWLEIDLKGTVSNRDGIGAQVLATTGGVTQLREQNNGVHLFAQNSQRIHFGLGNNTVVDSLVVKWPSGIVQTIQSIPSDRIIRVTEPPASPEASKDPGYSILQTGK